jgi:hypothetical protein
MLAVSLDCPLLIVPFGVLQCFFVYNSNEMSSVTIHFFLISHSIVSKINRHTEQKATKQYFPNIIMANGTCRCWRKSWLSGYGHIIYDCIFIFLLSKMHACLLLRQSCLPYIEKIWCSYITLASICCFTNWW